MERERQRPSEQLARTGVMAILRAPRAERFVDAAQVLVDAGITCVEMTMNSSGCLDALRVARRLLPADVTVGVGTVIDTDQLCAAAQAGAEFVVSPHVDPRLIARTVELGLRCYPGAWTPTELLVAWRAGATAVKIFPASVGGPGYIRQLRGPFPDIPLIPTGGIVIESVGDYLRAGALAVGLGRPLLGDVESDCAQAELGARARRVLAEVALARDLA